MKLFLIVCLALFVSLGLATIDLEKIVYAIDCGSHEAYTTGSGVEY